VLSACRQSYKFIKEAIKQNEATGWWAELDEENQEDEEAPATQGNNGQEGN